MYSITIIHYNDNVLIVLINFMNNIVNNGK